MKLSMSLLAKYLNRYHLECDLCDDRMDIRGIRFLSDQRLSLTSEYVYLEKADSYLSDEKYTGAYLIANGKSRILCFNCDYEELLNDLMAAFEYYNALEQRLWELSANHAPLQDILDIAFELVEAPMIVADLDGNILASRSTEQYSSNPEMCYFAQNKKMPPWSLCRKFKDAQGQEVHDLCDYPKRMYAEKENESAVAMYLSQDGEPVAFFLIFEHRNSGDFFHLHMQSYLAPFFLQSGEITGANSIIRSNHSILTRLLSGEKVPTQALQKFEERTHLQKPWQLSILHNLTIQNYTQRSLLIRGLNTLKTACFAMDFEGDVLLLLEERSHDAMLRELRYQINLQNVALGISMPFMTLENFTVAYRQAKFALGYQTGPGVYQCRAYALAYLVENIRNQEMVAELLHPAINTLYQYDKENQTHLLHTLLVYVQENRSQIETAQRLNIHRNTIKYRLERIDQLTGIDFSNWEECNYLNLSLLLTDKIPSSQIL